jgi:hypothetical protein
MNLMDAASASGASASPSKASPTKVQGSPPGSAIKNFNKKLVKHTATISPSPSKKKLLKKESTMNIKGSNNDLKMV